MSMVVPFTVTVSSRCRLYNFLHNPGVPSLAFMVSTIDLHNHRNPILIWLGPCLVVYRSNVTFHKCHNRVLVFILPMGYVSDHYEKLDGVLGLLGSSVVIHPFKFPFKFRRAMNWYQCKAWVSFISQCFTTSAHLVYLFLHINTVIVSVGSVGFGVFLSSWLGFISFFIACMVLAVPILKYNAT